MLWNSRDLTEIPSLTRVLLFESCRSFLGVNILGAFSLPVELSVSSIVVFRACRCLQKIIGVGFIGDFIFVFLIFFLFFVDLSFCVNELVPCSVPLVSFARSVLKLDQYASSSVM